MSDVKSALEIAMEKVAKMGAATPEERLSWQYVPEGEKLAVRYMKEDINLLVELQRHEKNARRYIIEGAGDVLIRNITLPKDSPAKKSNRRAMDGLKVLKTDKAGVENIFSKMRRIFAHYLEQGQQQKQQAYVTLKADFEAKFQQAVRQQMGALTSYKVDAEKQPQFQEEWRKLQVRLDSQYIKLLDEYKQELRTIP